jgi:N-acetylmuramic acid 6-phosphate etherase
MLRTEMRNPKTMNIDKMSTAEMVDTMISESYNAIRAVEAASAAIARAVDVISYAISKGGRLIYIGAGTSGRLGVLDASECPPTFGVSPDMVVGIIAGGRECMFKASENAEDMSLAGAKDIESISCCENDVVVGISAAGGAKYVISALEKAKELGAATIGLSCNRGVALENVCDIFVCADTGPEVITGSTRLNAGTAQKIIMNMFTTCAFIKNEYVCENVMINLKGTNDKLKGRQKRIVSELCGVDIDTAEKLLEENELNIKKAIRAYKEKQ